MGRRIKYIIIAIGIILLMALILGRCGNALLEDLIVDVARATGNIITIKITGNGTTIPTTDIVVAKGDNSPIPISATAYTDWAFIQWQGSGVVFADANSADTTVQLTGGDTTITAVFGDLTLGWPLMINNNGHGTTDQDGLQYVTVGDPTSTITISPDTGYELYQSNWITEAGVAVVNPVVDGTSYTITVTSPGTAIMLADFALKQYTLTVNDDGNGTTTPAGDIIVNHGAATSITAAITDPMRYIFDNWSLVSGTAQIGNSNSASTTVTLVTDGGATVQANFEKYGLYWTTYSSPYLVYRATLGFSDMTAIAGVSAPCAGIDIDTANEHVYYSDYSGKIWKSDMNGGSQSNIYSTGGYIYAVALDSVNEKLYFAASSIGIGRINLDGSGYETFVSGPNYRGVAVDAAGGYVYLSTLSGISRATIAGTLPKTPSPLFSASNSYEIDLDVAAGQMYWVEWSSNGRCGRAFMNGSGGVTYIVPGGLSYPRGIDLDVDNSRMYIANQGNNSIYEYDLTGSLISSFPASGSPSGIAVDTDP